MLMCMDSPGMYLYSTTKGGAVATVVLLALGKQ